MQSMATQLPEFGLLSLAVLPTMVSGGIDLSVVATANLASIVAALLLTTPGVPGWSAILAALAVGAAWRRSQRGLDRDLPVPGHPGHAGHAAVDQWPSPSC